ncbi:outer membrane lipoprotein carrier protein LolA [Elusimicrobiota bacterium]
MKNLYRGAEKNKVVWKGRDKIAERKTHRFKAAPKEENKYYYKENFWGDSEFSFPLKFDLLTVNDTMLYSIEYADILFNTELDKKIFQFKFPPQTTIVRWSLAGKSYKLSRTKRDMNFKLKLPTTLSEDMKLTKIVKAPGLIPAACLIYYDDLYYLILTEIKDYGLPVPPPRGIPVPDIAEDARLNLFGESSIISWTKKGVKLTLTGNLPYYEMLSIAENIK